jgi:hypothetical protein
LLVLANRGWGGAAAVACPWCTTEKIVWWRYNLRHCLWKNTPLLLVDDLLLLLDYGG